MNTLENCMVDCPIVHGLADETKSALLQTHRNECLERRMGQLGLLCGIQSNEAKNLLTRAALEASKQEPLVAV